MANKKFSEFVLKTSTSDVSHIVGYNGAENVQITPANFVTTGGTGVFLPLAGGTMTGALVVDAQGTFNDILTAGLGLAITGGAVGSAKLVLASNNAVYLRGSSAGLILQNSAGTNSLTVDTDSVFSGSLGIAGVTPSEKLDTPNIVISGSTITGTTRANALYVDNLGGNSRFFSCGADASTNGSYSFRTGTSAALGTTLLTVTPTESTFYGNIFQSGNNVIKNITGNLFLDSATGYNLMFRPGGTEKMRLDSSGNLGLGTSSVGASDGRLKISAPSGVSAIAGLSLYGNNSATYGGSNVVRSFIGSQTDGSAFGADLFFSTNDTSNVLQERMRLDSGGRLGLGVANPDAFTSVSAQNLVLGNLSSSNGITILAGVTSFGNLAFADGTAASDQYRGLIQYGHTLNSMKFFTNTLERMVIDSSGNVGIGTSSPLFGLSLAQGSADVNRIGWNDNGGFKRASILCSSSSDALQFHTGTSDTERMRIDSSGNVGIGAAPTNYGSSYTNLDSSGTNGSYYTLTGTTTGIKVDIAADGGSGAGYVGTKTAHPFVFRTQDAERMRISSGGDVLIGKSVSAVSTAGIAYEKATNSFFSSIANSEITFAVYETTPSPQYRFYVSGGGQIFATNTSITAISDISLKENIKPLETGLNEVMKLQPRRFDWKNGDGENIAGFIAQEVEEVLPDLISDQKYTDKETKKSLKMGDMIPTLVNAIQELKAEIELLKNK